MSELEIGLALAAFSALLTAFAHATLKVGGDKLAVQAWIRLIGLAIASPLAIWVGLPPRDLWPWLIAAASVHAIYQFLLSWSYSVSDFSVAYPVARGIAPILTAILGIAVLGDQLSAGVAVSIFTVSIGILILASGRSISPTGFMAAVATGALTMAYSVIDAKGMRLSPDLYTFIAWFFVLDGVSMPVALVVARREKAAALFFENARVGIAAGLLAPLSFVPVLYAFRLAPVGAVAAIRETSVLVGLLVAAYMLKETIDRRRVGGASLIMIGALGIIAASVHG